jgi:signal peptidase II
MYFFLFTVSVIIVDQGTKYLVSHTMQLHQSIPLIGSFVRFTYIRNTGIAFGIKPGNTTLCLIITVIAILALVVIYVTLNKKSAFLVTALAAITGGAMGNFLDRLFYGNVIDFIDIGIRNYRWPIFNVADIAVTAGVIMVLTFSMKKDGGNGRKAHFTRASSPEHSQNQTRSLS